MRRVKYFDNADLSAGMMADNAAQVLKGVKIECVNDALEVWNSLLFLHNELVSEEILPEDETVESFTAALKGSVAAFFTSLSDLNIVDAFNGVEYYYRTDLVDAVIRYRVDSRVSAELLLNAMTGAGVGLGDMLASHQFVHKFGAELRSRLLSNPVLVEILIASHVRSERTVKLFPPREISMDEWTAILLKYINGPDANLNYLRLIRDARSQDIPGLNDDVRISAISRCEELEADLRDNLTGGFRVGYSIILGESDREYVDKDEDGVLEYALTYSRAWLEDTLEFPSVLNNLQALFGFADDNVILTLPSYSSEMQGLEALLVFNGKTNYPRGVQFYTKERIAISQMATYVQFLNENGVDLEDVYLWFFNEYIPDNYGGVKIVYRRSSPESTYLERIRHLVAEMEGVLRQFQLYSNLGEIDSRRLQYGSHDVVIENVPSQASDKYAVPVVGSDIGRVMNALFSDQSILNYVDDSKSDENFSMLLLRQNLKMEDFHDYQRPDIEWLQDIGILDQGLHRVRFRSISQVALLSRLYRVGAVNARWLRGDERTELESLLNSGRVSWRSTLFSADESKFLNYMLNDREFSDGPRLRNNYLHSRVPLDESGKQERYDYVRILIIMAQIIIKINDDFRVMELPPIASSWRP